MDIRFMVKDVNGEEYGWRIQSDRSGYALSRFIGIAGEDTKTPGEERWGQTTYPSTFAGTIRSMIQTGMRVFPGDLIEVCRTVQDLQNEILRVLAPLEDVQELTRVIDVKVAEIDKNLKILEQDDKMPARIRPEKEKKEEVEAEETDDFNLLDDDEEFSIN